jgi:hypothetical protein
MAAPNPIHATGALTSDDKARRSIIQASIGARVDMNADRLTDAEALRRLELWVNTLAMSGQFYNALLDIAGFAQLVAEREARRDADRDPA